MSRWRIMSRNFHPVSTCSSGNGGFEGKKAFRARCSITPESLPIEYSITGLANSATTSRMMPMDSASRRFRWADNSGPDFLSLMTCPSCRELMRFEGATGDEPGIAKLWLAVVERLRVGPLDVPTRGDQHRLSGGSVPFHRRTQPRIQIRLTRRDQAEF